MLPKKNRLNLRKEFFTLKKNGRMINSESFGFLYAGGANWGEFGFIVSTKISKKAVERNLIRRRLSEIVRLTEKLPQINGVFLCKKAILSKTYKELKKEVEQIFKKLGNY